MADPWRKVKGDLVIKGDVVDPIRAAPCSTRALLMFWQGMVA
jgi:hypothetical protein